MRTLNKLLYAAVLGGLVAIGVAYLYFAVRHLGL